MTVALTITPLSCCGCSPYLGILYPQPSPSDAIRTSIRQRFDLEKRV